MRCGRYTSRAAEAGSSSSGFNRVFYDVKIHVCFTHALQACSTSPPSGNQVDGLPLVAHLLYQEFHDQRPSAASKWTSEEQFRCVCVLRGARALRAPGRLAPRALCARCYAEVENSIYHNAIFNAVILLIVDLVWPDFRLN